MADISRDCFTDLTPDNQLYEILQALVVASAAIDSINGDTTAAQLIVGSAPLSASTAAGTTTISSTQAGAATAGYLSSTDWNTFNNKVNRSGDTMTGKLVLSDGIKLDPQTPASPQIGDMWIANATLNFQDNTGVNKQVAATNAINAFTQRQTIDVSIANTALRVTQRGTGEALRVEDDTTPDATAFVISNLGRVGIGVTPDATVSLSVDTTGLKFGDGTIQTTAATGTSTDVQTFTANGTWTKPAGAKSLHVIAIGGGGGGGGGRKSASGTAAFGGGGGGGGAYTERVFDANFAGATETITIGAGGTGGAGATINSSNGIGGVAGGNTSFGSIILVRGGSQGAGGSTASAAGGASAIGGMFAGSSGGAGQSGTGTGAPNSAAAGAGGGGAGGVSTVPAAAAGGNGGNATSAFPLAIVGGVGGAINSNGANASSVTATFPAGASGGGGAGSSITGNAGIGGNGGTYGGGGGGGGAALDGVGNAGDGGVGGNGIVIVTTYF